MNLTKSTFGALIAACLAGTGFAQAAGAKPALSAPSTLSPSAAPTPPSACNPGAARDAYAAAADSARQRLREGEATPKLQKDKVGSVLVARPAPPPTDEDALRADIEQLAKLLDKSSTAVCDEALKVRRKHAL